MEGVRVAVQEMGQLSPSGQTKDVDSNAEALLIGLCRCLVEPASHSWASAQGH